jgi:hypothetical protein
MSNLEATGSIFRRSDDSPPENLEYDRSIEATIDSIITDRMRIWGTWITSLVLAVVFGGIIASLWGINSKVSVVVGQESVRDLLMDISEKKIDLLDGEKKVLITQIQTIKDNANKSMNTLEDEIDLLKSEKETTILEITELKNSNVEFQKEVARLRIENQRLKAAEI